MKFSTFILPILSIAPVISTPIGWNQHYSVADQSTQPDTLPAHLYDAVQYLAKLPKDELKLIVGQWEVGVEAAITTLREEISKISKLDQGKRSQLGSLTTDLMNEWLSVDQSNPLLLGLIAEKYEAKYDALTQSTDHSDHQDHQVQTEHSDRATNHSEAQAQVQPTQQSPGARSGGDFLSALQGFLQV